MPIYLHCPHCEHPQVVPQRRRGRTVFCRQCGRAYVTSRTTSDVRPLAESSISELENRRRARKLATILGV